MITFDEPLASYRVAYQRTQTHGMSVLVGWAASNIAVGIVGATRASDEFRFIHEMNALWNTVNLALGIVGLIGARRTRSLPTSLRAARVRFERTRRIFLVNAALDVLYVASGAVMGALGRHYQIGRLTGYGESIAFQGGFLFVFDLAMVWSHERVAARHVGPTALRGRAGLSSAIQPSSSPSSGG